MHEVNGKIMQQGFLESYFQMARKDLNQKAKDAQGEIRRLKWEIKQLEDRMKQMLRDMAETKIPREMDLQVLAEDQSSQEQLEAELKHHQGIDKFRMPDLKLIRQELKEWLKGLESKKIALHSLIKQITVYTNATLEVTYNAGYLSNQTRALDYTPYTSYLLRGFE